MRHDLISRTRYSWDDVGCALSWRDFHAFLTMLPVDSALYRATHPASWTWDSGAVTSHLLANLVDESRVSNYMYCKAHGGNPSEPKPIKRPSGESESRRRFDVEAFRRRIRGEEE